MKQVINVKQSSSLFHHYFGGIKNFFKRSNYFWKEQTNSVMSSSYMSIWIDCKFELKSCWQAFSKILADAKYLFCPIFHLGNFEACHYLFYNCVLPHVRWSPVQNNNLIGTSYSHSYWCLHLQLLKRDFESTLFTLATVEMTMIKR